MHSEIPKAFVTPWTGCDFSDDDSFYEPPPIELNRSQCIACERVFFVNHHNQSHNTFARCLNSIHDKEELQILWYPHCSMCLRLYTNNANMHWPEMNGWFINWDQHFGWDAILYCVRYRHPKTNQMMLPSSLRSVVALRVFQFLATRGECFPAQHSISREDNRRIQVERSNAIKARNSQRRLTTYFSPKTVKIPKKRKRVDVLQSSACMRSLLQKSRTLQPWFNLYVWDQVIRLRNQLEWVLTIDMVSLTNCVIRTSTCSKENIGPCMLDYWAMEGKSSQLIVYCMDSVNQEEVWSLWKDDCRTSHLDCEFMSSLFETLKKASEENRFQLSFIRESDSKNFWTHVGGRCMLIVHQYVRRPWLMQACDKWWKYLKS